MYMSAVDEGNVGAGRVEHMFVLWRFIAAKQGETYKGEK